MSDFPGILIRPGLNAITNFSIDQPVGALLSGTSTSAFAVVYTTANTAIYCPFSVDLPFLAQKMGVQVTTTDAAGHIDLGIYSEKGARLVSLGSTATGSVGLQVGNIADTWLMPGTYFMAMNSDSVTNAFASVSNNTIFAPGPARVCGFQQEAVGAIALPANATFAAVTQRAFPFMVVVGSPTL